MSQDDHDKAIIEALADEGMGAFTDALFVKRDGTVIEGVYCHVEDLTSEIDEHVNDHGAMISPLISQVGKPMSGDAIQAGGQWYRCNRRRPGTDTSLAPTECQLLDFDDLNQDQQDAVNAL